MIERARSAREQESEVKVAALALLCGNGLWLNGQGAQLALQTLLSPSLILVQHTVGSARRSDGSRTDGRNEQTTADDRSEEAYEVKEPEEGDDDRAGHFDPSQRRRGEQGAEFARCSEESHLCFALSFLRCIGGQARHRKGKSPPGHAPCGMTADERLDPDDERRAQIPKTLTEEHESEEEGGHEEHVAGLRYR